MFWGCIFRRWICQPLSLGQEAGGVVCACWGTRGRGIVLPGIYCLGNSPLLLKTLRSKQAYRVTAASASVRGRAGTEVGTGVLGGGGADGLRDRQGVPTVRETTGAGWQGREGRKGKRDEKASLSGGQVTVCRPLKLCLEEEASRELAALAVCPIEFPN